MCTKLNKEISDGYRSSGLDRRSFAEVMGISESTLSYHLKRAVSDGHGDMGRAASGFARLEVGPSLERIVVTTPGGTTIEIPL